MSRISMTIYGDPIALKRPKFHNIKAKDGRSFVSTYDPSKKDKENFLYSAMAENRPPMPMEGPLEMNLTFYMQRPKNHYGTGKNANVLKSSVPDWHISRPDIDNLVKFILDAFNETYWKDDNQVCKLSVMKIYTNMQPRTEIVIINL